MGNVKSYCNNPYCKEFNIPKVFNNLPITDCHEIIYCKNCHDPLFLNQNLEITKEKYNEPITLTPVLTNMVKHLKL